MKKLSMVADRDFSRDLIALAQLSDEDIDTSDAPETTSFLGAEIGRYSGLEFRGYDVRAIANWCINRAERESITATNMWLNKIVYFIYERALRDLNAILTPARLEAWEYGPVFREIYLNFPKTEEKLFHKFVVSKRAREVVDEIFEPVDIALFEKVWNELGHRSASQLTTLSHQKGSPWYVVWQHKGRVNPGMLIDIETILGRNADRDHGTN